MAFRGAERDGARSRHAGNAPPPALSVKTHSEAEVLEAVSDQQQQQRNIYYAGSVQGVGFR